MALRIGIDGRALEGHRAGTGRYVYELCRELAAAMPDDDFFVYSSKPIEPPVASERWHYRVEPLSAARRLKSILWLKLRGGRLVRKDKLDAYWANASFIPKLDDTVRVVATVHDLAYLLVPSTMKTVTYIAFRLFFRKDIRRANVILTNSAGTANRLKDHLGYLAGGVVKPAISAHFKPVDKEIVDKILKKLEVKRPYILAVGTLEPRKNLENTIVDFLRLQSKGQLVGVRLVLVGAKGWKTSELSKVLADANSTVTALGFVDDEDLPALYAGSSAFVFPSIYEGFGMPVLEAISCGARVFAYDLPEIREAGGLKASYAPVDRPIMELVVHALASPNETKHVALTEHERPTWIKEAETLVAALRGIA